MFAQSIQLVSRPRDCQFIVNIWPIGMMIQSLSFKGNSSHESESWSEIGKQKDLCDAFTIVTGFPSKNL